MVSAQLQSLLDEPLVRQLVVILSQAVTHPVVRGKAFLVLCLLFVLDLKWLRHALDRSVGQQLQMQLDRVTRRPDGGQRRSDSIEKDKEKEKYMQMCVQTTVSTVGMVVPNLLEQLLAKVKHAVSGAAPTVQETFTKISGN